MEATIESEVLWFGLEKFHWCFRACPVPICKCRRRSTKVAGVTFKFAYTCSMYSLVSQLCNISMKKCKHFSTERFAESDEAGQNPSAS